MKSKTIFAVFAIGVILSQTVMVAAVTPLVWVGVVLLGGVCLGGSCVANEYAESQPVCSASPMCDPGYCSDNPRICQIFSGKTVDCCGYMKII
jgi:hypothetical protein